MGRSSKDRRDIFYRLAKEEGWRARSAFKLLHIDSYFNIFEGVTRAVDLCAAPGSWSQVLAQQLRKNNSEIEKKKNSAREGDATAAPKGEVEVTPEGNASPETYIVAVDLQTMSPIPGVICLKGDITEEKTAQEVIKNLGNSKAQLVVCDGAPDVTGWHGLDEFLQAQLLYSALNIATLILEEGGTFVAKFFRASAIGVETVYSRLILFFEEVTIAKPRSSRSTSIESFVVCRNFKLPADFIPGKLIKFAEEFHGMDVESNNPNPGMRDKIIKFVACGDLDGYDADTTYPFHGESLPPVQPPIHPPYEEAVRRRKAGLAEKTDADEGADLYDANDCQDAQAQAQAQLKPKNKPPKQKTRKFFIPKSQEQIDAEQEEIDTENEKIGAINDAHRNKLHRWANGADPDNPEAMSYRRGIALEEDRDINPKYEARRTALSDAIKRVDNRRANCYPVLEEIKQTDPEAYTFLTRYHRRGCVNVWDPSLDFSDESEDEFSGYEYLLQPLMSRRSAWNKRVKRNGRQAKHRDKFYENPLNFKARRFQPDDPEEFEKKSDDEKVAAYRAAAEAGMDFNSGRFHYPFEFGEEDKNTEEYKIERWRVAHFGASEVNSTISPWMHRTPSPDQFKFHDHPQKTHLHGPRIKILLSFGGGAEKLVGDVREKEIMLPAPRMDSASNLHKHTMKMLLKWIKNNLIVERPELFITEDGNVRPGILVLINDMDWELLGNLDYWLAENDRVAFISTLHGG